MKLRKLKKQDAPMMLEWMHDPQVVENMKTDFLSKTIQDCERFIEQAQNTSESLHLAIADDRDEYMGTVSLKHIRDKTAELGRLFRLRNERDHPNRLRKTGPEEHLLVRRSPERESRTLLRKERMPQMPLPGAG